MCIYGWMCFGWQKPCDQSRKYILKEVFFSCFFSFYSWETCFCCGSCVQLHHCLQSDFVGWWYELCMHLGTPTCDFYLDCCMWLDSLSYFKTIVFLWWIELFEVHRLLLVFVYAHLKFGLSCDFSQGLHLIAEFDVDDDESLLLSNTFVMIFLFFLFLAK